MRFTLFMLTAAAAALGGCSSPSAVREAAPAPETLQADDLPSMEKDGKTCGERMLRAVQNRDYEGFTRFFPPEVKKKFDVKAFAQFDTYIGKLEKWEYLTLLARPAVTTCVWKVTVSRPDGKGNTLRTDMLFQVSLTKENGKYKVVGSYFL